MSNIDKIFKEGLNGHQMTPDADVWASLSKTLSSKEGKVVLPWYYNPKKAILGALFVSLLSFSVGFFYAQYNESAQDKKSLANNKEPKQDDRSFAAAFNRVRLENAPKGYDITNEINTAKENGLSKRGGANLPKVFSAQEVSSGKAVGNQIIRNVSPLLVSVASLKSGGFGRLSNFFSIKNNPNNIPTVQINERLSKTHFDRFRVSLNAMATPTGSALMEHFNEGATVDIMLKESSSYNLSSASLGFKYFITKNFGFATGLMFDRSVLSISGSRIGYDKADDSNLENRDRVSEMSYTRTYSSDAIFLPLGLTLTGKKSMFGYHVDFGGFLSQTLTQNRSFTVSDEIWVPLANEWETQVFDTKPNFGLYSSIGIDTYLGKNLGLSIDAIIRKRFVPVLSYGEFENEVIRKGLQVGLFYRF